MPMQFKCPKCRQLLQANAQAAGKRARCKHCQTKFIIPRPRPNSALVGGDLFSDLPEFESFDTPVKKPDSGDALFRQALASATNVESVTEPGSRFETSPSTPADSDRPGSYSSLASTDGGQRGDEDLAGVLDSIGKTIDDAVADQQRRNAAAIAPKLTVAQVKVAFGNEMLDFDHGAKVSGQPTMIALTMVVLPLLFSVAVMTFTLALIALPLGWLPISFATTLTYGGIFLYPLAWMVLFAAWIPVLHLLAAACSMLFSGSRERTSQHQISEENQPVMFEFVAQICQKVGAPIPSRIDLDTNFNASASFRRGWASFGKNDLVLTLGIPLVACQNASQLASVIAHEFGHFRQGSAMRSNYLVRCLTG